MPELPDVQVYLEALDRRIVGETLEKVRVVSPSLLRTYDPPLSAVEGRTVEALDRRIVSSGCARTPVGSVTATPILRFPKSNAIVRILGTVAAGAQRGQGCAIVCR